MQSFHDYPNTPFSAERKGFSEKIFWQKLEFDWVATAIYFDQNIEMYQNISLQIDVQDDIVIMAPQKARKQIECTFGFNQIFLMHNPISAR